jgi:hypothetical protein
MLTGPMAHHKSDILVIKDCGGFSRPNCNPNRLSPEQ